MRATTLMRLLAAASCLVALASTPALAAEKLRIATTSRCPPFTFVGDAGEIVLLDVDTALALCGEFGAECEVVPEEPEPRNPYPRFHAVAMHPPIAPVQANPEQPPPKRQGTIGRERGRCSYLILVDIDPLSGWLDGLNERLPPAGNRSLRLSITHILGFIRALPQFVVLKV